MNYTLLQSATRYTEQRVFRCVADYILHVIIFRLITEIYKELPQDRRIHTESEYGAVFLKMS